jgi:hypothetical protein
MVRGTVVAGIPSRTVTSSGGRWAKWRWIPFPERLFVRIVTSIERSDGVLIPQSAAADRWLRTASRPEASTAAIHSPSRDTTRCPTA